MTSRPLVLALVAVGLAAGHLAAPAAAVEGAWRRTISYQDKKDLFYNFYEGPDPSGTAAAMYVSPRPVPAHVGHTYTTYQPLMPHEYLYRHTRSHYAHVPGAGWSRAKVRYRTFGLRLDDVWFDLTGCRY
ncbi:MAG TPA: hypothetical protein PKC18_08870 [Lacipirellulaceae bacterium]|nr:hypothetical protein [Lacipirellulaceae bacterium]